VGISCYAATYGKVRELATLCKQRGIYVVVGGEQITSMPHLLTKDMDIGVRGEGETVFNDLLHRYKNGWQKSQLEQIEGLVYRDDHGRLVIMPPSKPVDIDSLPIPDLLLNNEKNDILCLMTSRGCPYQCAFCATGWHNNVHWMSPEKVVETIIFHVQKYPHLRTVFFWDDLFTVKLDRVRQIVQLLEADGLTKRLNYILCTRADHVNDDLLKLLVRMNCVHISMGLESGCDSTLNYINKRTTAAMNRRALELINSYHIHSSSSFVIGFPHETNEDIRQTYEFVKSVPINNIQVFLPIPYPGTRIWQYSLERGLVSEDMDWEQLDLIATMNEPQAVLHRFVVISEKLTRQEIYQWLIKFRRLRYRKIITFTILLLIKDPMIIINRLKRELLFFFRKIKYNYTQKKIY
jgi:Fe-S oxidoreductase